MTTFNIERLKSDEAPGDERLSINGAMTIENAAEIGSAVKEAFSQASSVLMDMKGVTDIDLAGLQIICSAHRSSLILRKGFTIEFDGNEQMNKVVHDIGFVNDKGCKEDTTNSCVWAGGGSK